MLTIGQLARIFEISTKTLRHYDAIGLFVPARTGSDNGYRYYQPEQIEQLSRILALRRLDVPLEAIDRLETRWRAGRPATPAAFPATTPAHPARRDQRPPAPAGGTRPNPGDARPLEDPQHACTNRRTSRLQRGGHGILRQRPRRHHRPALGTLHPRASTRSPASTIPRSPMASARSSPTANSTTSPASRCRRAGRCRRAWCASSVPAQKYAVFTHKGTAPQIAESFQAIYSHLLAERGLEPKAGST